jgi:hypothetical protein
VARRVSSTDVTPRCQLVVPSRRLQQKNRPVAPAARATTGRQGLTSCLHAPLATYPTTRLISPPQLAHRASTGRHWPQCSDVCCQRAAHQLLQQRHHLGGYQRQPGAAGNKHCSQQHRHGGAASHRQMYQVLRSSLSCQMWVSAPGEAGTTRLPALVHAAVLMSVQHVNTTPDGGRRTGSLKNFLSVVDLVFPVSASSLRSAGGGHA